MREIVHMQAGQCGNQIGAKVSDIFLNNYLNISWYKRYTGVVIGTYGHALPVFSISTHTL